MATQEQVSILLKMQADLRAVREASLALRGVGEDVRNVTRRSAEMRSQLGHMAKMGGVFALTQQPIQLMSRQIASLARRGGELSDFADQLGLTAENLQVLEQAAREGGGSSEQLRGALVALRTNAVDAADGVGSTVKAFATLGLQAEQIRNLSPEKQLEAIAQAMVRQTDQQAAYAAAADILGARNAPRLIIALQRLGRDGFGKLSADVRATTTLMTDDTAHAIDDLGDKVDQLKSRLANMAAGTLLTGGGLGAAAALGVATQLGRIQRFGSSQAQFAAWTAYGQQMAATVAAGYSAGVGPALLNGTKTAFAGISAFVRTIAGTVFNPLVLAATAVGGLAISWLEQRALARNDADSARRNGDFDALSQVRGQLSAATNRQQLGDAEVAAADRVYDLRMRLVGADEEETRHLETIIGHYEAITRLIREQGAALIQRNQRDLDFKTTRARELEDAKHLAELQKKLAAAYPERKREHRLLQIDQMAPEDQLRAYDELIQDARDYAAQDLSGVLQGNALRAEMLERESAVLRLVAQRRRIEDAITEAKVRQADLAGPDYASLKEISPADEAAARRTLAELTIQQSDDALQGFARQRGRSDANPYLTDHAKALERVRILRDENAEIEQQVQNLRDLQDAGGDWEALQAQIRSLQNRSADNDVSIYQSQPILGVRNNVVAQMADMETSLGTTAERVASLWTTTADTIRTSLGAAFADAILEGGTFAERAMAFSNMVARSFIATGAQMVADWAFRHTIMAAIKAAFGAKDIAQTATTETVKAGLVMGGEAATTGAVISGESAKTTAVVSAEIAKTSAVLAGEATRTAAIGASATANTAVITSAAGAQAGATGVAGVFRSIMELGPIAGPVVFAASVAGMIALVSKLAGFAEGGFTGAGAKFEPAGIVHRGEFVFPADVTAKVGPSRLYGLMDSLRAGRSAPQFGAPMAPGSASGGAGGAAGAKPMRFIHVMAPDMASARAMARDPEFDNVLNDWARRNRGEILGGQS